MKIGEQQFCESLLSVGRPQGALNLVQVTRGGALLMALPRNQKIALATIDLYQPQKWKGRLLKRAVRTLVEMKIHGFLPKLVIEAGSDGLLGKLDIIHAQNKFGFLLGGYDSIRRSMIGVYEHDGNLTVVKSGFGEASEAIIREHKITKHFSGRMRCVPEVHNLIKLDDGYAYTSEFVKGVSPRGAADDVLVFETLSSWLDQAVTRRVSDLSIWSSMCAAITDAEYGEISAIENIEILCPVMHGDFAPWNIKLLNGSEIKVLDWEYAEDLGVPGWDAIHYIVQRLILVEHAATDHVVKSCLQALKEQPISGSIERAGLTGYEQELFLSYLYFSDRIHLYSRDELIGAYRELSMS